MDYDNFNVRSRNFVNFLYNLGFDQLTKIKLSGTMNEMNKEIKDLFSNFTKKTYDKYGNHAYSSGFLEVLAGNMMADLPRERREEIQRQLEQHLAGL